MKALSRCSIEGSFEFVVHVDGEYDYRFICQKREELFDSFKAVYFKIKNENLPIYSVPSKLKEFATTKKECAKNIVKVPPEDFREYKEDLFEPVQEQ